MSKRRVKTEAIENLKRVVDVNNDNVEVVGTMDIVMTDAYDDSLKTDEHLQAVNKELDARAKEVITDNPDTGKEIKNQFTAKLTLDEAMEDFVLNETEEAPKKVDGRSRRVDDDDDDEFDRDPHLECDMSDFLFLCFRGLEGNANRNADMKRFLGLDRPVHTFSPTFRKKKNYNAEDEFDDALGGDIQIKGGHDRYYLYNDDIEYFDDAIQICEKLRLKYIPPRSKESPTEYWNFRMIVEIPTSQRGYPMMLVDYLESIGLELEDVMHPKFVTTYYNKLRKENLELKAHANDVKVDRVVTAYLKSIEKDTRPLKIKQKELIAKLKLDDLTFNRKEIMQRLNDAEVQRMYTEEVRIAATSSEPIEDHINQLLQTLNKSGVTYNEDDIRSRFNAEFADEYPDDDE